ncbi:uncharacterized protein ACNLHF_027331 [Anomaloglossus baeobatrachus]
MQRASSMSPVKRKGAKAQTLYASCTACGTFLPAGSTDPHCVQCSAPAALAQSGPLLDVSQGVPPVNAVQVTGTEFAAFADRMSLTMSQILDTLRARPVLQTTDTVHVLPPGPPQLLAPGRASTPQGEDSDSDDGPGQPKRARYDGPSHSSQWSGSQRDESMGDEADLTDQDSDPGTALNLDTPDGDAIVNDLIFNINKMLNISPPAPPVEESASQHERIHFRYPKRTLSTFLDHADFRDAIQKPHSYPERRFPKRLKDTRYPFPSEVVKGWTQCPKVDPPISRLAARSLVAVEDGAALKDATDRQMELWLKSIYEAIGASLAPSFAAVWALQAITAGLARVDSVTRAFAPQVAPLTSQMAAFASYAINAVLDATSRTAVASANSVVLRRALWLRHWKADSHSKKCLTNLPFSRDRLFGERLDEIIKHSKGKDSSLPQHRQNKPQQRRGQSGYRSFRGQGRSQFASSKKTQKDQRRSNSWRSQSRPKRPAGGTVAKTTSS